MQRPERRELTGNHAMEQVYPGETILENGTTMDAGTTDSDSKAEEGAGFDKPKLSVTLRAHGWASVRLEGGNHSITLQASYLTDALGDLAQATADLLLDEDRQAHWIWEDEPGEHLWLAERDGDQLLVTLYSDTAVIDGEKQDDSAGGLLLVAREETTTLHWAKEVERELRQVLEQYGEDGYMAKWGDDQAPFPTKELEEIQAWIRKNEPGTPKRPTEPGEGSKKRQSLSESLERTPAHQVTRHTSVLLLGAAAVSQATGLLSGVQIAHPLLAALLAIAGLWFYVMSNAMRREIEAAS